MKPFPLTPAHLAWLEKNSAVPPATLYLRHHGDEELTFLTLQAEARAKARGKLTDWPMHPGFIFPNLLSVEQCTSTALAAIHATLIEPGATVADMTAGLGIDALHLARVAASVTAFDLNPDNALALTLNARSAGLTNIRALCANSVEHLAEHPQERYDAIFIDPARRSAGGGRVYVLADCEPDVTALLPLLSRHTRRLIVKASPMLDVSATTAAFAPYACDVMLLGTSTECKELLVTVDFLTPATEHEPLITALTVPGGEPFSFTRPEEAAATPAYGLPAPGCLLYEPYPALAKAGAFRLLSARCGLTKLSPQSHIYFSAPAPAAGPQPSLPARPWRVEAVLPWGKRTIKEVKERWPQISVATRHFPLSAEELRRRLRVSEGPGHTKLWGVTAADGARHLIIGTAVPPRPAQ